MNYLTKLVNAIKNNLEINRKLDLCSVETLFIYENNRDYPLDSKESLFSFLNNNSKALQEIEKLYLSDNSFYNIPAFVFKLKNLKELDLNRNYLSSLPSEITNLRNLRFLDLSNNNIKELPKYFFELRKLKTFKIYRNELNEIPEEIIHLINMETLKFSNNKIKRIPEKIIEMEHLRDLKLFDNPIENIPYGIYNQGNGINPLRIYLKSIKSNSIDYFQCKIIITGNGEVGKTTIIENLKDIVCLHNHTSTVCLNVVPYEFPSEDGKNVYQCNIWDLGGQGKYRTVQQLFLTPNAVYLYVTVPEQMKKEEKYGNDEYWLQLIKVLGDSSSVIFVTNKIDQLKGQSGFVNNYDLNERFPFIKAFISTQFHRTGKSKESVLEINKAITDCLDNNETFVFKINKLWKDIINELNKQKKEGTQIITIKEYHHLCERLGLSEKGERKTLLEYLNVSGTVLRYSSEKTHAFSDLIILNPNWIKNEVYKVLNYLEKEKKYSFVENDLKEIWDDYDIDIRRYIDLIDLLKDLNFAFSNNKETIIPSLLPSDQGSKFDHVYSYHCTFKPYIPAGLLHKFVSNNHYRITKFINLYENRMTFLWDRQFEIDAIENWKESKIQLKLNTAEIAIIHTIRSEINKAIKEFEGRNYASEIEKEEKIEFKGNDYSISHINQIDNINLINKIIINNQIIINHAKNVTISESNLKSFPIKDHHTITINNSMYGHQIRLNQLWEKEGRDFFSTTKDYTNAILLKNQDWYQLLYTENKAQSAVNLIQKLSKDSEKIKFVALPKELWNTVKIKWPDLHFNNHQVFKFQANSNINSFKVERLEINDIDFLMQNQKYIDEYGGRDYLQHRINQGLTACIREKGNPIAWVLLNDDGSMGFLKVQQNWRRKRVAFDLISSFINQVYESGKTPIAYISQYNQASIGLANKLNGTKIGEVSWIRLRTKEEIEQYKAGLF